MKKTLSLVLLAVASTCMMASSCGKKGGGEPPAEEDLVISTTPANGSVSPAVAQENFTLSVSIDSKMPPNGVRINISAAPETGGPSFYGFFGVPTTSKTSTFTITGTPVQQSCIVTVNVVSVSKPSNSATSSYRYSRK